MSVPKHYRYRKCRARTTKGEPCATPGHLVRESGYCASHDPDLAKERAARSSSGGKARSRNFGIKDYELPTLDSPAAAAAWMDRVGRAVAIGAMKHGDATACIRAVDTFLRAHRDGEVTEEIQRLRDALDAWKRGDKDALLEVAS